MKFLLKPTDPNKFDVDILNVFCRQNRIDDIASIFPAEVKALIKEAALRENFSGKSGQFLTAAGRGIISPYKLFISGIGEEKEIDVFSVQECIAKGVQKMQADTKPVRIAYIVPEDWMKQFGVSNAAAALVEAVHLSIYRFQKYKGEEDKKEHREIEEVILTVPSNKIQAAEDGIRRGVLYSQAVFFARDLVNEPAHVATPSHLASIAQAIAKSSNGLVKTTVYEKEQIEKLGMHAYLGVSKGSDEPPKFIRMEYKPHGAKLSKPVVLIGKGITFDTGGLSLKSAEHMETMKLDMAGAAVLLGVFRALIDLKPAVSIIGLIAACENMPSGRAMKPGDIVKAYNGKTIEVLNTDAEGRLTLADMLSYAIRNEKPEAVIDVATLTGACMVALGHEIAGMWSNNDLLAAALMAAAAKTGEKIWRMPLENGYKDLIKSHIADVKNIQSGKYGGAITAALFLQEFVGIASWVHFDIAGPAFSEKNFPLTPAGGTGFGVRMLLEYISSL